MNEEDRETLKVNHHFLVTNLDLGHQRLKALLVQEGLLNSMDVQILEASIMETNYRTKA